jgi:hypothetical protein
LFKAVGECEWSLDGEFNKDVDSLQSSGLDAGEYGDDVVDVVASKVASLLSSCLYSSQLNIPRVWLYAYR